MIRALRCRLADDTGASLVLALAAMTGLGLVVGALLTYSGAAIHSTVATRDRAETVYDAGGALQQAINNVRNSTFDNVTGETCPTIATSGWNSTRPVKVVCDGGPGTGAEGSQVPISSSNKPGSALLTLSQDPGETGIAQGSNNILRIHGRVYSNSTIVANPGALEVEGAQVIARGACVGSITSTPAKSCNDTSFNPAGLDPAIAAPTSYAQPTSGLVYRSVPTCPSGPTVKFSPGYYDDAVGLTNLMSSCLGKTFWFQPASGGGVGVYYFDFHNGEGGGLATGSRVWTINNTSVRVVGGTPTGSGPTAWDPDAIPRQVPDIPGSCVSPLETTANNGVEFVFGGDSRLTILAGQMELCGQYYSNKPPITVYGAKTGTDTTASGTGKTDGTGTNSGTVPFTNPAKITENDGVPSIAVLAASMSAGTDAMVTVRGFAPSTSPPAGSILTKADLIVKHQEIGTDLPTGLSATVTPVRSDASALTGIAQPSVYADKTYHSEVIDLQAALAAEVHTYGFSGLKVSYGATVKKKTSATENLDTIQLSLEWRPPQVRAEDATVNGTASCVGNGPYTSPSSTTHCALIHTQNNPTRLYIQGTTYVPKAAVDLQLTNVSGQVFRSGLISRIVSITITASSSMTGAVIEVPDDAAGPTPLDVYFRAYVCPDETCVSDPPAAPWRLLVTASAAFEDPGGSPSAGHRDVTIKSWAVVRQSS